MIVGGGNVGLEVASTLEDRESRVSRQNDRAGAAPAPKCAAEALERTIVLNGDGLDSRELC